MTPTRVALIVSWNLSYCRAVLRGVRRFAMDHPDWVLTPLDPSAATARTARQLAVSGTIVHAYDAHLLRTLKAWRVPVVNVSGVFASAGFPRVGIDDVAVGNLAAGHLLERGLRHFGFAGGGTDRYAVLREQGYQDALAEKQMTVHSLRLKGSEQFTPQGQPWGLRVEVRRWLMGLPKPVGVFAVNDLWGVQLAEACRQEGIRVPEDVAIVGVDDDDLLCRLARPSLSSVGVPGEQIGFAAAATLKALIRSRRSSVDLSEKLLPPTGVVTRQSSDLVATSDREVALAVRMIRDASRVGLSTRDVIDAVPLGRRTLERRFRKVIGRGISAEIRRMELERAKSLLRETTLPMPEVARRAGLSDARKLSTVFRQAFGMTPTHYRRTSIVET